MNTWKRKALALASVPLLAVPSAAGVYLWLVPHIGPLFAGLTATGFESLYIGINILVITTPELRRYARNVALSGVLTAVIFNTLARYQAMVCPPLSVAEIAADVISACTLRSAAFDGLALALAVLESIPLAGLAYAISVLLHRLSEQEAQARPVSRRPAQLRATIRRLVRQLRSVRAELAPLRAMFAQAQADRAQAVDVAAQMRADVAQQLAESAQAIVAAAQAQGEAARMDRERAQVQADYDRQAETLAHARAQAAQEAETAARLATDLAHTRAGLEHIEAELTHARATQAKADQSAAQLARDLELAQASAGLDVLRLARAFNERGMPWREIGLLLGVPDATLRARLKAAENGHMIVEPSR